MFLSSQFGAPLLRLVGSHVGVPSPDALAGCLPKMQLMVAAKCGILVARHIFDTGWLQPGEARGPRSQDVLPPCAGLSLVPLLLAPWGEGRGRNTHNKLDIRSCRGAGDVLMVGPTLQRARPDVPAGAAVPHDSQIVNETFLVKVVRPQEEQWNVSNGRHNILPHAGSKQWN